MPELSLYLHIPFCVRKCPYCDFNSYAGLDSLASDYLDALVTELHGGIAAHHLSGRSLSTIYLGGGTPSLLSPEQVAALLAAARSELPADEDWEVTMEANPGTLDAAKLAGYRAAGVNRISVGAQSFDDQVLAFLGRIHTAREARGAIELARRAGFDNLSVDLIWAVPGQTLRGWRETLRQAGELGPEHISAYCLTYEEGTPLSARRARGDFEPADEDLELEMLRATIEILTRAGYEHYEISNFARPGLECRHNLAYWTGEDYIGIGAGAHSHIAGLRWWNERDPAGYVERVAAGCSAVEGQERLEGRRRVGETILTGLRLTRGISLDDADRRTGCNPRDLFAEELAELTGLGLLELADGVARLTEKGLELADEVGLRFVDAE